MELHVVTVFVGVDGRHGNPLGVFLGAGRRDPADRQAVAAELGFSETVFVEERASATLRIHTPGAELPLAGHPLVGTSWLLRQLGTPVDVLHPVPGPVPTWADEERTWIRANPADAPPFELRQLATPSDVDACVAAEAEPDALLDVWSWVDEAAGRVRSRVFGPRVGVPEDEATGSAALRLTAHLGRALDIRQGLGSQILTRPGQDGLVEVGGRCELVEVRDVAW